MSNHEVITIGRFTNIPAGFEYVVHDILAREALAGPPTPKAPHVPSGPPRSPWAIRKEMDYGDYDDLDF